MRALNRIHADTEIAVRVDLRARTLFYAHGDQN
jgi:hypothetical protein